MKYNLRRLMAMLMVVILLSVDLAAFAELVKSEPETALPDIPRLVLPASLDVIEEEAFMGATSIGYVVVPEGTTAIEARAFANSSLVGIELPASINSIADDAFSGCGISQLLRPRTPLRTTGA